MGYAIFMGIIAIVWAIYLIGTIYSFFEGLYYWDALGFRGFDDLLTWAVEWPKVFILRFFY